MIYNAIFILLLLFALVEMYMFHRNIVTKPKIYIGVIICVVLILFAGGRVDTGLDFGAYLQYFDRAKDGSLSVFNTIVEPMYVILNKIAPSFRCLLFLMAIGCVGIKYLAFKKLNVQLISFVMLVYFATFFLYYDMGIMRQGFSMGICILSIPYAQKKDWRFFLLEIIATLFHISAILFVPVFFLAGKELKRPLYYGLMTVALALAVASRAGISQSGFFGRLLKTIGGAYLQHKVDVYFSGGTKDYLVTVVKRIIIGIVYIEWVKRNRGDNALSWTYINGYVLSIVLFSFMTITGFASLAGRMTAGLYMLYCLANERILASKRNPAVRFCLFLLFVALSYSTLHNVVTSSTGDTYSNYHFFFP